MKNLKILFFTIAIFTYGINSISALGCTSSDNTQLRKEAYKVKVDYELIDNSKQGILTIRKAKKKFLIPNYTFEISIYNFNSNNIYLEINDELGRVSKKVFFEETKDGIYTFKDDSFTEIDKYTFAVNSNIPQCSGETIKSYTLTKPKYNIFSQYDYCEKSEESFCKKFISTDLNIYSEDEFLSLINADNTLDSSKSRESFKSSLKSNKRIIIYTFITTFLIAIIIIIIRKLKTKGGEI